MSLHLIARSAICVLWLALFVVLPARSASAQMRGTIAVGGGVSAAVPTSSELKRTVKLTPTFRRLPKQGWGLAAGFNWYDVDVEGAFVDAPGRLGRLVVRPVMLGIGYTAVRGRLNVSPSVVAGPALNTLTVDDEHREEFAVRGSEFAARARTVTFVVRPSVTVTYALAPRFGLTASGGYLFNRPNFTVNTPRGAIDVPWTADAITLHTGIVVSVF